jgi:hypothetical protein
VADERVSEGSGLAVRQVPTPGLPDPSPATATWARAWNDITIVFTLSSLLTGLLLWPSRALLGNPLGPIDPLALAAGGGLRWTVNEVGFPFGMSVIPYFPTLEYSQNALNQFFQLFTDNPYLPGNLVWVLSYPLTAVAAWWVAKLVGTPRPLAIALAVSYAFLPFHSIRGMSHLYLATSWPAALGVGLSVLVGAGRVPRIRGVRLRSIGGGQAAGLIALTLIVSLSGIYYAFFGLLLMTLALVWRFACGYPVRSILREAVPLVMVGAIALVALSVIAVAARSAPPSQPVAVRYPYESNLYGGDLSFLLVPSPLTDVPGVKQLARPFDRYVIPNLERQSYGQFGSIVTTTSVVGLLVGLVVLRRGRQRQPDLTPGLDNQTGLLLVLIVGSAAFFAARSLNFLFALYVTPAIRSWDRLLPYLLLLLPLAAISLARQLDLLTGRRAQLLAAVAIVLVTVPDGVTPYATAINRALAKTHAATSAAEQYATAVNAATPGRCGVLQLPYVAFPESPPKHHLADYEHFLVALGNPLKQWSYGGVKYTIQSAWADALRDDLTESTLPALAEVGFCGVHLDTRGYSAKKAPLIEARLTGLLGAPVARGLGGRWQFYRLPEGAPGGTSVSDVSSLSTSARMLFYGRP